MDMGQEIHTAVSAKGGGLRSILNYAEYVLLSAVAVSVLVSLFVLFPATDTPPVNPYREGQSVLAPPEGATVSYGIRVLP